MRYSIHLRNTFIRSKLKKSLDQFRERWTSIGKVTWIDRQRKVNKRFHAATRVDRPFAFFFSPRVLSLATSNTGGADKKKEERGRRKK